MKNSEDNYLEAKQKVHKIKQFYAHLIVFLVINLFLAGLNYYQNSWSYPWFLWVTAGWGIGVVFDYLSAFQINPFSTKSGKNAGSMSLWKKRKNGSIGSNVLV